MSGRTSHGPVLVLLLVASCAVPTSDGFDEVQAEVDRRIGKRVEWHDPATAAGGVPGPFGEISMGGMFTVLKVRDRIDDQHDPGPYAHPAGTVAAPARAEELERDGIKIDASRAPAPRGDAHRHH